MHDDEQSSAYISKGTKRNWVKVRLPNEAHALNAIVTVTLPDDTVLTKQLMTSQGLGSDQGRELIFGLGDAEAIKQISVMYQDGTTQKVEDTTVRQTYDLSK